MNVEFIFLLRRRCSTTTFISSRAAGLLLVTTFVGRPFCPRETSNGVNWCCRPMSPWRPSCRAWAQQFIAVLPMFLFFFHFPLINSVFYLLNFRVNFYTSCCCFFFLTIICRPFLSIIITFLGFLYTIWCNKDGAILL